MNSWMNKKRKIRFLYMEYIEKLHSQHKSISFIELKEKEKMFLLLTKLKYEYIGIVFIFHKTFGEICKIIFLSTGERKKKLLIHISRQSKKIYNEWKNMKRSIFMLTIECQKWKDDVRMCVSAFSAISCVLSKVAY